MAKLESLKDIKASAAETVAEVRKPKRDKFVRSYATGKRKDAVARVWVKPGKGNITVNTKTLDEYFARPVLKMIINQPFELPTASTNSTSFARSAAAVCPARPVRLSTVFPKP